MPASDVPPALVGVWRRGARAGEHERDHGSGERERSEFGQGEIPSMPTLRLAAESGSALPARNGRPTSGQRDESLDRDPSSEREQHPADTDEDRRGHHPNFHLPSKSAPHSPRSSSSELAYPASPSFITHRACNAHPALDSARILPRERHLTPRCRNATGDAEIALRGTLLRSVGATETRRDGPRTTSSTSDTPAPDHL